MRPTHSHPAMPDRLRSCLAAATVITAAAFTVLTLADPASAATTTLYVAPNGTGTACSSSQPCSITQAKTNVQAINGSMTSDIAVELANGTYRLTAPLTFTSADSGTGGYTVTWKAALGAHPVLTGAQQATGWTQHDSTKKHLAGECRYRVRHPAVVRQRRPGDEGALLDHPLQRPADC
jgi:hypothetical protein